MCSIVVGCETDKVKQLVKLNKSRGSHSYSIYYIDQHDQKLEYAAKQLGELDPEKIDIPEGCYAVIHQQAPTTQAKGIESVHPSSLATSHLWHNGIIKSYCCDKLRQEMNVEHVWDTRLLHELIARSKSLSQIDGSFACVEYIEHKALFIFRNEISPFFYDGESFSSVPFEGAKSLPANRVYRVDYDTKGVSLCPVNSFTTKVNPYYFGD